MCKETKTDKPIWQIKKEEAKARKAAAAANPEKAVYDLSVVNLEYFRDNMLELSKGLAEISAATSRMTSALEHILNQICYKPSK